MITDFKITKKTAPFGNYFKLQVELDGEWFEACTQKSTEGAWHKRVEELKRHTVCLDLTIQPEAWRKL